MYALAQFLRENALSCPSKKFLHLECPGCGLQRALILLLEGRVGASIAMYPALIPMVLLGLLLVLHLIFKWRHGAAILQWLFIICAAIICANYMLKIARGLVVVI
jgi:hypothetical protein